MQNWVDLYKELTDKAAAIDGVQWVDLWHNQINFLADELPFPAPAVFLGFRLLGALDVGDRVQQVRMQVDAYLFYETFADTYRGSVNQDSALAFLTLLNSLYTAYHGTSGENYSNMRRIALAPLDTGGAGNLYQVSFECLIMDYAAQKVLVDGEASGIELVNGTGPQSEPDTEIFFDVV
jgi:hypothetical protein